MFDVNSVVILCYTFVLNKRTFTLVPEHFVVFYFYFLISVNLILTNVPLCSE